MNTVKKHARHGLSQFELSKKVLNNLKQWKLTPTAKLVLLFLADCYNPKKADMFPKQKTIAEKLDVSERSVIRAIQELVKEGLIIIECKISNKYKFTSKIVPECPENLSDDKRQNVSKENDKMSATCIEQKRETNKSTKEDEFLIKFAESKGAKNKVAYINAIKRNGGATEIVNEMRQIEANKKAMQNMTKTFLEADKESRETSVAPTKEWRDLKAHLQQLCK